jgi:hypothetical protein
MSTNDDGKSFFARYIEDPEKERQPVSSKLSPVQKFPPAQKLLDWLQHNWTKPTVSARDIYVYGPNSIRDRESAINLAEFLVKHAWLAPIKTRRRDMKQWPKPQPQQFRSCSQAATIRSGMASSPASTAPVAM